jgi:hypothetical protein
MTSSGPRGKNKGQQGYKQKRMMKRVMEAFIKKTLFTRRSLHHRVRGNFK